MNNPSRNKYRTDRAIKHWRQKITEQQISNQTPGEFCRQRNLCSTSFYAWRKRLGMKSPVPEFTRRSSALLPVVKRPPLSPVPLKPSPGAGFLRLDPAVAVNSRESGIEQGTRVMWIETPGGYRVAVNGSVGLAEVFGLLKAL